MSSYSIHAPDSYQVMPWKNGRGETLVLRSHSVPGSDEFAWRLSIAKVDSDGPFSHFPGCDRTLVLLDGGGITLSHGNGQLDELSARFSIANFAGDDKTEACLHNGPIRDFNVISHRNFCTAGVALCGDEFRTETTIDADTVLVYALGNAVEISIPEQSLVKVDPYHLMQYDRPIRGRWCITPGPAIVIQIVST